MNKVYFGILAAGKGTRMKSDLPKVLHRIADKPLVNHVLETVKNIENQGVYLIIGHGADLVKEQTADFDAQYVLQAQQLGTGHAVMMLEPSLKGKTGLLVVLCGDVPFIQQKTIEDLIKFHELKNAQATVLTIELANAGNYGRIVREANGDLWKIVEAKDATADELAIKEINSGIYVFQLPILFDILSQLKTNNKQGEYYLTDVIELLRAQGNKVVATKTEHEWEVAGINTVEDLQSMEKFFMTVLQTK